MFDVRHISPISPVGPIHATPKHVPTAPRVALPYSTPPPQKLVGICSATDLNAFTERLRTWLRFSPVGSQFR